MHKQFPCSQDLYIFRCLSLLLKEKLRMYLVSAQSMPSFQQTIFWGGWTQITLDPWPEFTIYIYIYKLLLTTQQILGTTYNTSTQGICVNEEFGGAECTAYRLLRGWIRINVPYQPPPWMNTTIIAVVIRRFCMNRAGSVSIFKWLKQHQEGPHTCETWM
jgi:hypothetical protein